MSARRRVLPLQPRAPLQCHGPAAVELLLHVRDVLLRLPGPPRLQEAVLRRELHPRVLLLQRLRPRPARPGARHQGLRLQARQGGRLGVGRDAPSPTCDAQPPAGSPSSPTTPAAGGQPRLRPRSSPCPFLWPRHDHCLICAHCAHVGLIVGMWVSGLIIANAMPRLFVVAGGSLGGVACFRPMALCIRDSGWFKAGGAAPGGAASLSSAGRAARRRRASPRVRGRSAPFRWPRSDVSRGRVGPGPSSRALEPLGSAPCVRQAMDAVACSLWTFRGRRQAGSKPRRGLRSGHEDRRAVLVPVQAHQVLL